MAKKEDRSCSNCKYLKQVRSIDITGIKDETGVTPDYFYECQDDNFVMESYMTDSFCCDRHQYCKRKM